MILDDKKQMTDEDIKLNYITPAINRSGWVGEWRQHHHGDEDYGWTDQSPWQHGIVSTMLSSHRNIEERYSMGKREWKLDQ